MRLSQLADVWHSVARFIMHVVDIFFSFFSLHFHLNSILRDAHYAKDPNEVRDIARVVYGQTETELIWFLQNSFSSSYRGATNAKAGLSR